MSFGRNARGQWPITTLLGITLFIGLIIGGFGGRIIAPKTVQVERAGGMFEPALGESYTLVTMSPVTATMGYFPDPNPIDAVEFVVRTPDGDHPGWMITQIISVPNELTAQVPSLPPGTVTFIKTPLGHQVFYNDGSTPAHGTRPRDQIFTNVAFAPLGK